MQKFKIFHSQFNSKRSKGFTFVEIIVVLVILAILAAVFIPSLVRYIDMSKEKSDLGTLGMLNRVTTAYRTEAYQNDTVADPFLDEENDSVELMNELVSESFLSERLVPLLPKAKFEWSLLYKQWTYVKADGQTVISLLASQEIIDEYLLSNPNNPWIKDTLGLASKYGLIFIPNNKESYTITSRAKLTVGNNLENNGGYGIAFETTLSGNEETGYKETGYIAQFDRGRGAIVIRKRLNGVENDQIKVFPVLDEAGYPINKEDSWWTESHDVTLDVNVSSQGKKNVSVSIKGLEPFTAFEINESSGTGDKYIGLRSWGPKTIFEELTIK